MTVRRFRDTYEFLEHCNGLGAAGIQSSINGDVPKIRARADQLGMFVESIVALPKSADTAAFEKSVQDAKAAGSTLVRVNAGGRRYEDFSTLADYEAVANRSRAAIKAAVAICEKNKVAFALENHKDWTSDELAKMMKQISTEYMGVCLDTGNNMALLEDPMQVIETLAPYAIATHVKDMAVGEIQEGFELSEVVFGEGMLDISKVIATIRAARPKVHITLEMITRDPLKVPCLLTKYWATFPDRSGYALVKFLQLVRSEPKRNVPHLSGLDRPAQLKAEEDNVKLCLDYARAKLTI